MENAQSETRLRDLNKFSFNVLSTHINNRELSDTIMNVVGAFMWVSVGATALHYWQGYMADHDQLVVVHERTVSIFDYFNPKCCLSQFITFFLITTIDFRLVWYLVHSVFYPVPCTWSTVYWHSFILQNNWQPICTSRIKKYITFTWQNDDFPILSLSITFKTLNT